MRASVIASLLGALAVLPLACSATHDQTDPGAFTADVDSGGGGFTIDGGPGGDGGGLQGDAVSSEGGPSGDDCPEELKQVYVVTEGNELYRFAPATLTFTKIGVVNCPSTGFGSSPFSMAVDRKGVGWVLFNDGHIFHVSTKDASCTATSYAVDQGGFHTFGMAFVSNAAGSSAETLYVADYNGTGIAKIDTSTLKLSFVGAYGVSAGAGELTGTGDAHMYAFFNQSPSRVAEVDRTTGKIKSMKDVPGLTVGSGWAFAHWGGSFWLFTAPSGTSQVNQYDFTAGTSKVVVSSLGYIIVGAGVSTCAPFAPPK